MLIGLKTHILARDIEKHLSLTSIRLDIDSRLPVSRTVVGSSKQYAESYLEKTEMV